MQTETTVILNLDPMDPNYLSRIEEIHWWIQQECRGKTWHGWVDTDYNTNDVYMKFENEREAIMFSLKFLTK